MCGDVGRDVAACCDAYAYASFKILIAAKIHTKKVGPKKVLKICEVTFFWIL